jgi:hypothetical protein
MMRFSPVLSFFSADAAEIINALKVRGARQPDGVGMLIVSAPEPDPLQISAWRDVIGAIFSEHRHNATQIERKPDDRRAFFVGQRFPRYGRLGPAHISESRS